jgi:hypothetical protein
MAVFFISHALIFRQIMKPVYEAFDKKMRVKHKRLLGYTKAF